MKCIVCNHWHYHTHQVFFIHDRDNDLVVERNVCHSEYKEIIEPLLKDKKNSEAKYTIPYTLRIVRKKLDEMRKLRRWN